MSTSEFFSRIIARFRRIWTQPKGKQPMTRWRAEMIRKGRLPPD